MQELNKTRVVKILRIVMPIVGVVIFLLTAPLSAIAVWLQPLPDTVQEQLDNAIAHDVDGLIVYVDQPGKDPALYAAGWKNREEQMPADPEALFKIASISKLYLATAAAKLVSDGSLSLDDTLTDYLPEYEGRIENADEITLRMMLQHRSGIPDFVDHPDWPWSEALPDVDALLEFALDEPAEFEPDRRYSYSNTNYLLIARIIDYALGYDHQDYIRAEILAPLGLTNTYGSADDIDLDDLDDLASGYHYGIEADQKGVRIIGSSGSMVATAQDVGIFLRALSDGSLLNDDEQAIYSSIYEYEHGGWILGYQSIARYHADTDTVVVLFMNSTGGDTEAVIYIIFNRIVRILNR